MSGQGLRAVGAFFISHLIFLALLRVGLSAELERARAELRRGVFWRGLFVALVAVPLLAIALARALPLTPVAASGLVLVAACPGSALLVRKVEGQRGNVALAEALVIALSLLCIVTVPLWVAILGALFPLQLQASPGALLRELAPSVVVPLGAGLAVRRLWPRGAKRARDVVHVLYLVAFALAALLVLSVGLPQLRHARGAGVVAVLLFTAASVLLGHLAGAPRPQDRISVAGAAVLLNPAIALHLVSVSYPQLRLAPLVFAYVIVRGLVLTPYQLWLRRRIAPRRHAPLRRRPARPHPTARA